MYSLTICFGPANTVWAFLFKDEEKAMSAHQRAKVAFLSTSGPRYPVEINDDFGQSVMVMDVHATLLEDLDQHEQARIQRALADERLKAKFMAAAKSDPIIRAAMGNQQSPIMTPMSGGFRGN